MDEKSKEIQKLKETRDYYDGLLKNNKKGKDEKYTCQEVAKRIFWHEERMRCTKLLKGDIV